MEILTFFLGEERFAVDITQVETIENKMAITTVPKSKNYILGLMNLRGSAIPVIDINTILSPENINTAFQKLIIVNTSRGKIALAVTDIDDALTVEENNIEELHGNRSITVVNYNSNIITLLTQNDFNKI